MSNRKKVLVISFSDLKSDPRVNRQIRFLKEEFEVHAIGLGSPELEDVTFYPLEMAVKSFAFQIKRAFFLKCRLYEKAYWEYSWKPNSFETLLNKLKGERFDIVVANDVETLPFAGEIAKEAEILFDAHEYAPSEFEDKFVWRFFLQGYRQYLCRTYIPSCKIMTTVCDGIADKYRKEFGIDRPELITNACNYYALHPSSVTETEIRMIHHGVASPSRKIEFMISLMDYTDERFSLDLMLVPTDRHYYSGLQKLIEGKKNVRIIQPVTMSELVEFSQPYDIGLFLLPETNLNYQFALPNKFFEFIQSRLAIAIGPSIEMKRLLNEYDLGIVSKDFLPESLARELNKQTKATIEKYKENAHKSANILSSNNSRKTLLRLVGNLLS